MEGKKRRAGNEHYIRPLPSRQWKQLEVCARGHMCQDNRYTSVLTINYRTETVVMFLIEQGCQTHFTGGHISLEVAFKGPNVILGLYKCNYALTRGKELGTATG